VHIAATAGALGLSSGKRRASYDDMTIDPNISYVQLMRTLPDGRILDAHLIHDKRPERVHEARVNIAGVVAWSGAWNDLTKERLIELGMQEDGAYVLAFQANSFFTDEEVRQKIQHELEPANK